MPLIDDRGRVLGRVNVIDATIVGFVLVLMPIIYTASRLFLVPKPVIERVEPAVQLAGSARRIRVVGRHLRPRMRAVASPTGLPSLIDPARYADEPLTTKLVSPSMAEIELGDLKPGSYDLRLFDSTEELARLTSAFTLTVPPPTPQVDKQAIARVIVRFVIMPQTAALLHQGDTAVTEPAPDGKPAARQQPPAQIKSVRVLQETVPPNVDYGGGWGARLIEAEIEMPVHQNARGEWQYRQEVVRVGDQLMFQTTRYTMRGLVGDVRISSVVDVELPAEVK